jgi:hypothetical protein
VLLEPLTAAVNCRLCPGATELDAGDKPIDTAAAAGFKVSTAVADWAGLATLVAVTVICVTELTLLGAV